MKSLLYALLFLVTSISAQSPLEIKSKFFGNNYYQGGERITKAEFENEITNNYEAFQLYKKGLSKQSLGQILSFGSGFITGYTISDFIKNDELNWTFAGISLVSLLTASAISHKGKVRVNKAIEVYNDGLSDIPTELDSYYIVNLGFIDSGIGISFNF